MACTYKEVHVNNIMMEKTIRQVLSGKDKNWNTTQSS